MSGLYFMALIISILGMTVIDKRFKLAYFYKPKQTVRILLIAVGVFIIWDVFGIVLDIFFIGSERYLLGLKIGQFPIEEILFLILLNYCSLLTYILFKRKWGAK